MELGGDGIPSFDRTVPSDAYVGVARARLEQWLRERFLTMSTTDAVAEAVVELALDAKERADVELARAQTRMEDARVALGKARGDLAAIRAAAQTTAG